MKQIEVTVKVNDSIKQVDKLLKDQGFKIIRTSRIEDKYMSNSHGVLSKDSILDILKKCVLVRFLNVNNKKYLKELHTKTRHIMVQLLYLKRK